MKYTTVIAKIGGGNISEAARRLEMPLSTVREWKRSGNVPHWRRNAVRLVAMKMGVNVDLDGPEDVREQLSTKVTVARSSKERAHHEQVA